MPDLKTDEQLLAMAIALAVEAHGEQMNKDGTLYMAPNKHSCHQPPHR